MGRTITILLTLILLAGSAGAAGQDVSDEIFYHFMPICWRDSDNDAYRFGDFGGMAASLDYLDSLGVTAVWMNPIFPSPAYHGYQHGPADQLNPWFGNETELTDFIEAAHIHGIKVFVDLVAYGISHDSVWFQDAYGNPGSPYDSWLAFTNGQNTEYLGSQYSTWNGDTVGFIHWDLRDPNPVGLVTGWAEGWLDPNGDESFVDGLDGYRLDHVWVHYPNGPDGWGYNLDTFWIPWRDALRSVNPDVFIFAEQADWGSYGTELLPGFDAAFTKPFEFAARDALRWEDAAPLYSSMNATVAALAGTSEPGNFLCTIGNHDVDRLASSIGDNFEKGKAAAAVLLTQPFPPVLYHGDEIGMRGSKNTGYFGDAADIPMREPFKWNAVAGPPMSNYFILNNEAYVGRISRDHDGRSVEEQLGNAASLLEAYRGLIGARTENIALRRGGYAAVPNSASSVWAFVRAAEEQKVLVAINVQGSTRISILDLSLFEIPGGSTTPTDVLTGEMLDPITDANKDAYTMNLPAYGYHILEVDLVPPPPPVSIVDGREIPGDLGPESLRATQDNATGFGDNLSELNQLFLRFAGDSLHLGLTGNLATDATGLVLLFDATPGGQNVLDLWNISPPPNGPAALTGTRLDAGFEPEQMLFINAFGGTIYVDRIELFTSGGGQKTYLGQGTVNSGNGLLGGGDNPNGFQLALDNTNSAGVTDTDPSGAATATTGFEIYVPFDDLDLPDSEKETLGVAAFLMRPDGEVGNQWLPGLGGGFDNLGIAPDLTLIPGNQFIEVTVPETTGVADPELLTFGLHHAFPNPSRSVITFRFTLPGEMRAHLTIYDVRGRIVRTLFDQHRRSGSQAEDWDGTTDIGPTAPVGVYFATLEAGGHLETTRLLLIR